MRNPRFFLCALALALACAAPHRQAEPAPQPNVDPTRREPPRASVGAQPPAVVEDSLDRMAPPEVAYARGWMPLASGGIDEFRRLHPRFDGRGVLVAILDTGIDPTVGGLATTSTGLPKVLDLRDFSGEGRISLARLTPTGDSVTIAGRSLGGFGRVQAVDGTGPYYGGTLAEIPLGEPPASDVNGNGRLGDTLAVVVAHANDGWVLFADTDGDGSLAAEQPVHDYFVARESFGWAPRGHHPRLAIAANFTETKGEPVLDLYFDNLGHGTHVAGIAAGNDLYGVAGFSGVAPGAQLLGLKIANDAQGGISASGAILAAADYALRFARDRRLPLVLNLSWGVGNEIEGGARIEALLDSLLQANPEVTLTISAGNDGPGLSTVGFPGSMGRAFTAGATFPGAFLPTGPTGAAAGDQLAYFSARGGEAAKPDVVTPGVAYSSVPRWYAGNELAQGTSMGAPYAAGMVALLQSALAQDTTGGRQPGQVPARVIRQALMVTAEPLAASSFVDEGTGLPNAERAWRWLQGGHDVPEILVRSLGGSPGSGAALEERPPERLDTVQAFELRRPASDPPATFTLSSDAPWLSAPPKITLSGAVGRVEVRYRRALLSAPGAYVGTVTGWGADTLAGPLFRLVNTVIVPAPLATGTATLRAAARVAPGGTLRTFFQADSARPFAVTVASGGLAERGLAFLHEPGGMPYRDQSARPMGTAEQAATYRVDGRDAQGGPYEVDVVAPPVGALAATVSVAQSPVRLSAVQSGSTITTTIANLASTTVKAELGFHIGGAERQETVAAQGPVVQWIPVVAPSWASGLEVDLTMDRSQWERFTDLGLSLFDSLGRQMGKQPVNYAFGRLQVPMPDGHADMALKVGLFPGFARADDRDPWTIHLAIRAFADTSRSLVPASGGAASVTAAPGKTASLTFTLPAESPWPLPPGFVPLGAVSARIGDRVWTRHVALSASGRARAQ
jgi:subtilisin family serine protease